MEKEEAETLALIRQNEELREALKLSVETLETIITALQPQSKVAVSGTKMIKKLRKLLLILSPQNQATEEG